MVVLAAGAAGAAAAGLLDMKGQLVAEGHTVGHIHLSPEEVEKYRRSPLVDHLGHGECTGPKCPLRKLAELLTIGIFFPPNEDNIIKLGAVRFFTNYSNGKVPGVSLPRYRSDNPSDEILGVPRDFEKHIRTWMKEMLPELADCKWNETRICWQVSSSFKPNQELTDIEMMFNS